MHQNNMDNLDKILEKEGKKTLYIFFLIIMQYRGKKSVWNWRSVNWEKKSMTTVN